MNKLDETLDDVQNTRFSNIYHDLIKQMVKTTQFNEIEVQSILLVYHKFVLMNGPKAKMMSNAQFHHLFLVLFKIYDLQIIQRILTLITTNAKKDINPTAWVKLFSVFMSNKLEQKIKFTFQIYNATNTGYLNREAVTLAVSKFFAGDDEDEVNELRAFLKLKTSNQRQDMLEVLFKKFDMDRDGAISYEEYAVVVKKNPMLLEFLGQCFPNVDGMTLVSGQENLKALVSIKLGKMNKLDSTLDDVQNTRFSNIYHDLIKQMAKTTQFSEMEVQSILLVYHKFVLANGPKAKTMTKKQFNNLFLVLFKIYDLQIIERILSLITSDLNKDVLPVAWVKLFSVFMANKLEQKMKFTFQIYNAANTGYLTRDVVTFAVEKFFTGEDEDEVNELRSDMLEVLFKKFDTDRDGAISYEEYAAVVTKEPMLLEFLGQCFPNVDGMTIIV
uniref:EF-hand domain-containing protein n=1 Tax=Glossina pallidipes TaxID=7398 RepID=A0A1A9Z6M0_GLOPL